MTTWTSNIVLAGAACLALAACDDLGGLTGPQDDGLPFVSLARGAVNLVPPIGYCVDKRSVRARFAVMARCDTLGGTPTFGAPLAVITAASIDQDAGGGAAGAGGETVLSRRTSGALTLLEVKGRPPSPEMRDVFWRAVAPVGTQVIGLAIYEAASEDPLGDRAPALLVETMRRTQERTATLAAAAQDNSATTPAKP